MKKITTIGMRAKITSPLMHLRMKASPGEEEEEICPKRCSLGEAENKIQLALNGTARTAPEMQLISNCSTE